MNKIQFILIISAILFSSHFSNAWNISKASHLPGESDSFVKQGVETLPHQCDEYGVWDFSQITLSGKECRVKTHLINDSLLLIVEGDRQRTLKLSGESVFMLRNDNRLASLNRDTPCHVFRFPMILGDSVSSELAFSGSYCNVNYITQNGHYTIKASKNGKLIMPDDTIDNVILLHKIIIAEECIANSKIPTYTDTIDFRADSYYWIAENYRYPLAETHTTHYTKNDSLITTDNSSFIFSPENQKYDIGNKDEKPDKAIKHKNNAKGTSISDLSAWKNGNEICYKFDITSNGIPVIAETTLTDLYGRIYSHTPKHEVQPGTTTSSIDISDLLPGSYILRVITQSSSAKTLIIIE